MKTLTIMTVTLAATIVAPARALGVPCNGAQAPVCTFANDFLGFQGTLNAMGATPRTIDFETLPNGSPSSGGINITPSFNYTAQGVTFTAPVSNPFLAGSGPGDFSLVSFSGSPAIHSWLTADFVVPTPAAGILFPGHTTLYAYSTGGSLIGSVSYDSLGSTGFLGIASDTPIARIIENRGSFGEEIDDLNFVPVPEPAKILLLGCGTLIACGAQRRARRRASTPSDAALESSAEARRVASSF